MHLHNVFKQVGMEELQIFDREVLKRHKDMFFRGGEESTLLSWVGVENVDLGPDLDPSLLGSSRLGQALEPSLQWGEGDKKFRSRPRPMPGLGRPLHTISHLLEQLLSLRPRTIFSCPPNALYIYLRCSFLDKFHFVLITPLT